MKQSLVLVCLYLAIFSGSVVSQEEAGKKPTGMAIPLPPLVNGGLSSLWYNDHKFILDKYGDFDLINYATAGFSHTKDSLTGYSWTPLAMGDFVKKELSYATLAKIKNNDNGLLLIMFQWHDPVDSTRAHGVYFHSFLGKNKLLLRTKQCTTGGVDTLEISCGDAKRPCGKCYYDTKKATMVLTMDNKQ